jgi:hypothetical protein
MQVGSVLRRFERAGRDEYERYAYPQIDMEV